MPNASITIDIGKNPKDYIDVIGASITYKRSRVKISQNGNLIKAEIDADDSRALLASIGSITKQFRIIGNVERILDGMSRKRVKR